jgi:TolB-like protein/Tfp pilus assembly protein PilF/predicted Ser/Thr protein kinase
MIGKTISHYKILEKLGEGGMGVVYKAEDTKLDRIVALKMLPPHLSASEQDKARFIQEAKAAATLNHPNICTIHSIEEHESQLFITMQFIDGQLLRGRMTGLAEKQAIDIGIQIADGLAAAHEKGIVHRDIKPENIMIRKDGIAQIMDFGLAKVKGGTPLTMAGSTVGTMGYMSPEQIQGFDIDHRADIFSLGVLLYEMATGDPPFRGEHDAAIMYEIVNVQPRNPGEVKPAMTPELERIIMKCLAKDRDERYHSAKDIVVDLRVLRKHSGSGIQTGSPQPGQAKGTPPLERTEVPEGRSKKEKRKPLVVGLGSLTLVLIVIAVWYFLGRSPGGTISSMVVLPFENVGADPDLEYLSDGVTEGIINKVSRIPDLRVIPRSASFRFKGSTRDPQSIGEELGVDAVLSGRVVQRGDRLDLTLELIDVREYSQIWGESYKRTMNDLITVQDEIVAEVSEKIKPGSIANAAMAEHVQTENPAAYRFYLQGKFYWNKRTAPDLERALSYYNQAIQLDRSFARAHLGLAETYLLQGQYSDKHSADILALAKTEAEKSLGLDNSLGEAHAALGMIREGEWDWEGAEREFKLAIEKAPRYATSYHWYFIYLKIVGREDEAFDIIKKGAELDPYSPIVLANLADAYLKKDDFSSADEVLQKILEIDPQFFFGNVWRAIVLHEQGKKNEGLEILDRVSLSGLSSLSLGFVGHHYGALGERTKATSVLNMLLGDSKNALPDPVAVAMVYTGLGNADSAMAWLQTAFDQDQKSRTLPVTRGRREFRLVHNDPRYLTILRKMGL